MGIIAKDTWDAFADDSDSQPYCDYCGNGPYDVDYNGDWALDEHELTRCPVCAEKTDEELEKDA